MRAAVLFATLLAACACKPRTDASALRDDGAPSSATDCRTGFEASCTPAQLDKLLGDMMGELDTAVLAVSREEDFVVSADFRLPGEGGYALTDELDINQLRTRIVDLRRDVGALNMGRETSARLGEVLGRIEGLVGKVEEAKRRTGAQAPDETGLRTIDLMTKQLQTLLTHVRAERTNAQAREAQERQAAEDARRAREAELQRIADEAARERQRQETAREYQEALRRVQESAARLRRECNDRCESAMSACDRRATTNSDRIVCRTQRWECVGRC